MEEWKTAFPWLHPVQFMGMDGDPKKMKTTRASSFGQCVYYANFVHTEDRVAVQHVCHSFESYWVSNKIVQRLENVPATCLVD